MWRHEGSQESKRSMILKNLGTPDLMQPSPRLTPCNYEKLQPHDSYPVIILGMWDRSCSHQVRQSSFNVAGQVFTRQHMLQVSGLVQVKKDVTHAVDVPLLT